MQSVEFLIDLGTNGGFVVVRQGDIGTNRCFFGMQRHPAFVNKNFLLINVWVVFGVFVIRIGYRTGRRAGFDFSYSEFFRRKGVCKAFETAPLST